MSGDVDVEQVEEALGGPVQENDQIRVWIEDPYMRGEQVRGNLYCLLKDDDSDPYQEKDVKVSQQNITQFVNAIQKAADIEKNTADDIFAGLFRLQSAAERKALENSSDSEHQEEKEELDVDEDEVTAVLEKGPLFEVVERTDDVHLGDKIMKTVAYCSALSRAINDVPLNLWAIGESGAGKTHLFRTMFSTIPRERKVKFNSCSAKSLYYFCDLHGEDALDGKVVFFNEAEASEDATAVLRSVTDTNEEDNRHLTVIDQEAIELNIEGTPVTWFTSVDPVKDGQLENRFMFGNPEEEENHKQEIAEHQTKNIRKGDLDPGRDVDFPVLKAVYRRIIEETAHKDVVIPFKWDWRQYEDARLQPYFGNLLHAITRINHANRPYTDKYIVSTLDDYYTAKLIWSRLQEVTLQKLKKKDMELLEHIPSDEKSAVTRAELQEVTGYGYGTVRGATERLSDAGLIIGDQKENREWHYWKAEDNLSPLVISLVQSSLEEEAVRSELEGVSKLVVENLVYEGEVSPIRAVTHTSPSYMEMLTTIYSEGDSSSLPIAERPEDCTAGLTIDPHIEEYTEPPQDDDDIPDKDQEFLADDLDPTDVVDLDEEEEDVVQYVKRVGAVHPGEFAHVADGSPHTIAERLVDKGLLEEAGTNPDGQVQYAYAGGPV